jgi:hypothetical protein
MTTPTPPTASANSTSTTPPKAKTPISLLVVELIGVSALTGIAAIGPRIGKLVAVFMIGILILWLITHASALAKLVGTL